MRTTVHSTPVASWCGVARAQTGAQKEDNVPCDLLPPEYDRHTVNDHSGAWIQLSACHEGRAFEVHSV